MGGVYGHHRRHDAGPGGQGYLDDELGWRPQIRFEDGLPTTIDWYLAHRSWWQRIRSGAYLEFYEKQYGARLEKETP